MQTSGACEGISFGSRRPAWLVAIRAWLYGLLLAGAGGPLLGLAVAGGLTRRARAALRLGRQLGNRDLAGGGGLAGNQGLRLVHFLFDFGQGFRLRWGSRRMELGAQMDDEAFLFVGFDARQALVLRVVQQFAEFLETVAPPVEVRLVLLD